GLHFWLVPVHSIAPSPVSAILSGWVVKLGFITYLKLMPGGNTLLLYLGILMIFYGGIKALLASDYKVLLAFSSISQLGYIAVGIGGGTVLGYTGAIFHIIAHGLAKTTLFSGSGYWIKEFATRSIYRFKSVQRQRVNFYATIISLLSLMGVPLFLGYSSKYLLKHGFEGQKIFILLFHVAGVLTVMYGLRFIKWGLVGRGKRQEAESSYSPVGFEKIAFILPAFLLVGGGVLTQLYPDLFGRHIHSFHLANGLITSTVYFLLATIILSGLDWIKAAEKSPPSLDKYLRRTYEIFYAISSRSREFDTDLFFESFLYGKIYNLSRSLYNIVFTGFQNQLLWIPLFLLLLLLWNTI
ncbi:MAG: proton-conducting transporter membrane subunit, partial [Halanaerobiales bacterium]